MQQIFGDAANESNGSTVRTITTAYDAASQITSISDPSSTINFTLDNLGRAATIAQSVIVLTPTVTPNQSFDAMNNRTELKASIASTLDFKNTYQFDQLQRLTDLVQQGQSGGTTVLAKHVTFAYNALSQRLRGLSLSFDRMFQEIRRGDHEKPISYNCNCRIFLFLRGNIFF